jgi:hypothetical protein
MVKVNGTKFKLYELDTDDSIISRIAVILNTLPKYLYFKEGKNDLKSFKNIEVSDTLEFIKTGVQDSTDYSKFLRRFNKNFPDAVATIQGESVQPSLQSEKELFTIWLAYNKRLEELQEIGGGVMLDSVGEEFVKNGHFQTLKDFTNFWKNTKPTIIRDLQQAISDHKNNTDRYTELYKAFSEIEEGLVYTPLRKEKVVFDIVLNLEDITLMEIFNHILLNEYIPFAVCKNYYKILKDYVPSEEWAKGGENDYITLKMYEKRDANLLVSKDYTDVVITVSDKVQASMQLITERGYLELDQFVKRFISVFYGLGDVQPSRVVEKKVFGIFYFPKEYLDSYVFSDLVMNNRNFSALINIDESKKATKKKGIGAQPLLYIHFTHPTSGAIAASIIQKFVDRSDPEMRDQDREVFSQNDPYIRVRVKGVSTQSIDSFISIFSKLLVIYNQKYNEIVEFYKQFIPDFGKIETVVKPDKSNDNKLQAPDIFISNYSRKCPNIPEIITEEEAKTYDYQKVMLYPRDTQENAPHYPSDGKDQKYYVCRNPDFPYPGVQVNKLKNKDDYPFTPCCFRDEQKDKKGRSYNKYFLNEEKDSREKKQQDFIITNKFVKVNQFGLLPQDLSNFLKLLYPKDDTAYKYVRLGVSDNQTQGKYSFLLSVMYGLYEQTQILDYEGDELEQKVLETLDEIKQVSVLARQSMYDSSVSDIDSQINMDTYFDPKYYLQLLEEFFNCNIYLFKNTGDSTRPVLPRYTQGYYRHKRPQSPCVFIYEHWGSESDSAKHPQCELVIKWREENRKDVEYFYSSHSKIIKNLDKFLSVLNGTYSLDKKLEHVNFPLNLSSVKLLSQKIDSYGKTRRIDLSYNKNKFSLLTSPIPPLRVKEEHSSPLYKLSTDVAVGIFGAIGIQLQSQTVVSGTCKEVNGVIGNVAVTIPVLDNSTLPDLAFSDSGLHFPESSQSALEIYNNNKKITRYITEYMFWLFSKYINSSGEEKITDKVVKNFVKENITLIPDYKYEIVPKTFSTSSKLMNDGKLIVESSEMLKRLLYILKLYTVRNYKSLINYHNQKVITHYYVDITDFTNHPRQVILQGDDAVDKWIQESKFRYLMYNTVMPSKNIPYFFRNNGVNNGAVFLAQNAESLDKSLAVSLTWQNQGYNTTIHNKAVKQSYRYTLHFYASPDNIVETQVAGEKSPESDINILVSKISDRLFYTALLGF